MQHITNNLPDAFTGHKGVTKSYIPAANVPERVEVPQKTTFSSNGQKRWRTLGTKDKAPKQPPRKKRNIIPQSVNANQPDVDGHLDSSTSAHTNTNAGTSERLDSIVMGNHEEPKGTNEISTNYIDSGESFNRKTTVVDIYFSSKIANTLQKDPEPKSMVECRSAQIGSNGRRQLRQN